MAIRKLRMGWDVGGWHCDRNRNSRDALVLLEVSGDDPQLLGEPWRGNLRRELALKGARLIHRMLELCKAQELGLFELTIAIDAPLGWPQAMLDLVNGGGQADVPEDDGLNPYTRRATEIDLVRSDYRPLSAVRDMIGSQSTKGIHFLWAAGLRPSSCGVWTSRQDSLSLTAIETYPAIAIRHSVVSKQHARIFALPPFQSHRTGNKDIKDTLICALVAHLFSDSPSDIEPIPTSAPASEGWIILPRNIEPVE